MSLQGDLDLAQRAARRGAAAALQHFRTALAVERKRTPVDVVTLADRESEAAVAALLAAERPGDAIAGEEGTTRAGGERRWVIDGLDGTFNFVSGVPHWCVAVALEEQGGEPLAAAVHDPLRDEHFSAARGLGCRAAGRRGAVREGRALHEALVATFLRTDKLAGRAAAPVLGALAEHAGMLRMGGSGTLDLAWVAAGRVDGWAQPDVDDWDWLPGRLLVEEAGGSCTVLDGDPAWHVAGSRAVAEGLIDLLHGLSASAGRAHRARDKEPEAMTQRPIGLTRDAGWEVGGSRTLPLPVDAAWALLISDQGLAAWLGEGIETPLAQGAGYRANDGTRGEVRSLRPLDRVRLTWQPPGRESPATLQVAIVEGASGTSVRFHAERLADAAERERVRDRFAAALDRLAALVPAAPSGGSAPG